MSAPVPQPGGRPPPRQKKRERKSKKERERKKKERNGKNERYKERMGVRIGRELHAVTKSVY